MDQNSAPNENRKKEMDLQDEAKTYQHRNSERSHHENAEDVLQRKLHNEERRANIWKDENIAEKIQPSPASTEDVNPTGKTASTQPSRRSTRSFLTEKKQISSRSLRRESARQPRQSQMSGSFHNRSILSEKTLISERSKRRMDVRKENRNDSNQQQLQQQQQSSHDLQPQTAKEMVSYFPTPGTADRILPTFNEGASLSSLEYSLDTPIPPYHHGYSLPLERETLVEAVVVQDDDDTSDIKEVFVSEIPYACQVVGEGEQQQNPKWQRWAFVTCFLVLFLVATTMTVTVVVLQKDSKQQPSHTTSVPLFDGIPPIYIDTIEGNESSDSGIPVDMTHQSTEEPTVDEQFNDGRKTPAPTNSPLMVHATEPPMGQVMYVTETPATITIASMDTTEIAATSPGK